MAKGRLASLRMTFTRRIPTVPFVAAKESGAISAYETKPSHVKARHTLGRCCSVAEKALITSAEVSGLNLCGLYGLCGLCGLSGLCHFCHFHPMSHPVVRSTGLTGDFARDFPPR